MSRRLPSNADRRRLSIPAFVFYALAGLIAVFGTSVLVVGSLAHRSTQEDLRPLVSGTYTIVLSLVSWFVAVLFWALGAALSCLHDTRETGRTIAMRLLRESPHSVPGRERANELRADEDNTSSIAP